MAGGRTRRFFFSFNPVPGKQWPDPNGRPRRVHFRKSNASNEIPTGGDKNGISTDTYSGTEVNAMRFLRDHEKDYGPRSVNILIKRFINQNPIVDSPSLPEI